MNVSVKGRAGMDVSKPVSKRAEVAAPEKEEPKPRVSAPKKRARSKKES